MIFTGSGKWCLPKNAHQVIRSMRHIDFRLSIPMVKIGFLVYKCRLDGHNRNHSYFILIRPQSTICRRFFYWQYFPGRGLGYGWKWQKWKKMAFSTTNHITRNALYISTTSTTCNNAIMHILFITIIITQIWGDFYFSYKYPIRYHNNLQFVNKQMIRIWYNIE